MFYAFNFKKTRKYILIGLCIAIGIFACYTAIRTLYPLKNVSLIYKYSNKYGLDPAFVCAVIHTESRFNDTAVSEKGASGLMQIMKQTADWGAGEIGLQDYSYDKIFAPNINIELGCWYLSKLLNQYNGNEKTALAAYNAGSGNIAKWLNDKRYSSDGENIDNIPFSQTDGYIKKVTVAKKIYTIMLKYFGGTYE